MNSRLAWAIWQDAAPPPKIQKEKKGLEVGRGTVTWLSKDQPDNVCDFHPRSPTVEGRSQVLHATL